MTRKQTFEVFKYEQDLKIESMKALNRVQDNQIQDEYIVQVALMQDRLYKKFGVEQEDYNIAISHHNMVEDPEVLRILKSVEEQYPPNLKQKIVQNLTQQEEEENGEYDEALRHQDFEGFEFEDDRFQGVDQNYQYIQNDSS